MRPYRHQGFTSSITISKTPEGDRTITFTSNDPRPVSVVGDFNGWDPSLHPLDIETDGQRSITIPVPVQDEVRFRYNSFRQSEFQRWAAQTTHRYFASAKTSSCF